MGYVFGTPDPPKRRNPLNTTRSACTPSCRGRTCAASTPDEAIVTEAYSPLGRGQALRELAIRELASRHNQTPAQIVLCWQLQLGTVAIPKAVIPERLKENFELT